MTAPAPKRLVDFRNVIFFDCHTGEYPGKKCFQQFDPRQIVDLAAKAGANLISFFSKDHFGNCFCDLPGGHKHRDVKGDYTGAVVAEARRRGLGVCIYYSVFADRKEGLEHPDWEPQSPDYLKMFEGKGFPWRTLCHNSPFVDEVFIPHLTTLVRRYRPKALFLDPMNFAGVCTCKGCRVAWREMYGCEMDAGELKANPRKWATFFHTTWNRAFHRAFEACHAIDPNIEFSFGPRHDDPDLAAGVETICPFEGAETNLCYVNADLGILSPGLYARAIRTRNLPGMLMINAFNGCWGEATVKNATLLQAEMAATHANGLRYAVAEYLRSWGKLEPEAMKVMGQAVRAEDEFRDLAVGWSAPKHIAVLENNTFPGNPCGPGAGKLLVEAHQQFDFIDETKLDKLDGYKLLWSPPAKLWRDERWQQVLEWVQAGGTLLLEASEELAASRGLKAILKAAGIGAVKPSKFSAMYLLPEKAHADERHSAMPIMVHEPSWVVQPGKAKRLIDLADPLAEWDPSKGIVFRMNVIHADLASRRAGVVEGKVGKGCVVLLPAAISRAYWQHNYSPLRRMVVRLIAAHAKAPFEVDVPAYVEANLLVAPPPSAESGKTQPGGRPWRMPQKTVLHLVQYCLNHSGGSDSEMWCGDRYHDIESTRPLYDVPVRIRAATRPAAVYAYPGKKKLPFTYKSGVVEAKLPRLDLHAAVVIE